MALVDPTLEESEWLAIAACRGTDPGLFFPDGTTTPEAQEKTDGAKAVCLSCKCRMECLEYAIETNQDSGIWGGKSEMERRQMRRDIRNNTMTKEEILKVGN